MDWTATGKAITEWLRKYRWAALILAAGLFMMMIPEGTEQAAQTEQPETRKEMTLQQELEELLGKLDGAGRVKVLLSISSGERYHYQENEDVSRTADTVDSRKEVVLITSGDRTEHGLLQCVDPPVYQGAVVLCQGADSAQVKLAVVEAVATATGLGSDRISVLKMK